MNFFFSILKKHNISITLISEICLVIMTVCVILQNHAFIFNPLIIALFNVSYLFPLPLAIGSSCLYVIIGLIININYGIELLFICSLNWILSIITKKLSSNFRNQIMSFSLSFVITVMYCFLLKTPTDYINLGISFITSIVLSYLLNRALSDYISFNKINDYVITLSLILISIVFIKVNSISFFVTALLFASCIKRMYKKEVLLALFPLLAIETVFYNLPLELLIALFASFFVGALVPIKKFNELLMIIVFTSFIVIYDQKFYLLQEYYQVVGGILISYFVPTKELNKVNFKYDIDKLETISNFCTLLEDKRFSRYTDLEKVLLNEIQENVCLKCNKRDSCQLLHNKIVSSYIDEKTKQDIVNECLYSYQVMKKISLHNQIFFDFNTNECALSENRINLIKPYSFIKKMAEQEINESEYNLNFEMEIEYISQGFSAKNGDCYEKIELGKHHYLLLSDGMGHTKESNDVSSYLIALVKMLLPYEENVIKLIKDVNKIMLSKTCEEVYATLDIGKFDMENGKLELYKLGSFSTFFIRNKVVKEYTPFLPPIGIVNNFKEKEDIISFQKGDIFIFMTDGFGDNVSELISSTIQKSSFLNIHNYTRFLFNKLKQNNCEDDKTIIGIKIR